MKTKESSMKKMCSFYVSDWHLTTMLLPYISKLVEANVEIETILEQGMDEKINELISRLNMKENLKQKILEINWKSLEKIEIENFHKNTDKPKVIFINGTKEKIEKMNQLLEEELEEKEKITLVNCYEASEIQNNIEEILNKHDNIINTSGEHPINEVFSFFKK